MAGEHVKNDHDKIKRIVREKVAGCIEAGELSALRSYLFALCDDGCYYEVAYHERLPDPSNFPMNGNPEKGFPIDRQATEHESFLRFRPGDSLRTALKEGVVAQGRCVDGMLLDQGEKRALEILNDIPLSGYFRSHKVAPANAAILAFEMDESGLAKYLLILTSIVNLGTYRGTQDRVSCSLPKTKNAVAEFACAIESLVRTELELPPPAPPSAADLSRAEKAQVLRAMQEAGMVDPVGSSMWDLCHEWAKIAKSDLPVIVTGPTGTGKELFAKYIHNISCRSGGPLIAVNCAAIPDKLFEGVVFGGERGAWSGLEETRIGLIEQAEGGTLFLDELAELSLAHQAKILRAIDDHHIRRVGGVADIYVDFRVICATNADLKSVSVETFREDLLYRVGNANVELPPLAKRPEIERIADALLLKFVKQHGLSEKRFAQEAYGALIEFGCDGNYRTLAALIEIVSILAESDTIRVSDVRNSAQRAAWR